MTSLVLGLAVGVGAAVAPSTAVASHDDPGVRAATARPSTTASFDGAGGRVHPAFAAAASRVSANRSDPSTPAARPAGRDPMTDFIGNNYFDECGDAGQFDLKKFAIIDNEVEDLTYLWGTCPRVTAPTAPGSSMVFFIDDTTDQAPSSFPSLALIQSTVDATWELFETFRSPNEGDWELNQAGTGRIDTVGADDAGPRNVGSISIDAIAADFPLRYFVSAVTVTGGSSDDVIPEPDMPPIRFPDGCDYFELHAARVTAAGPVGATLAGAALRASVASTAPRGTGTVLGWPLSDAQVSALDALPGVTATRPVMFRALADPEPTQWARDQTRLERAWTAVPSAPAVVAVLDQGVDGTRPDLRGRVTEGFDALTNELFPVGHNSALGPHGTAVSGIIAAERDNDTEVAGVNDVATIIPIRVFDHSSCADDQSIADGLDWAARRPVDVINLSLGGPGESRILEQAVDRAVASGAILIAATGNDEEVAPGRPSYPAAYPNVIGIGATGPNGVAAYSQSAATEFVAPGGAFTGQRESDYAVLGEWDRIEFQAGTSFSAPFVAGLVSLWHASNPGATLEQLRASLRAAAIDLPGDRDGAGLIDAVLLLGERPPPGWVPPAPGIDGDPSTSHRLDHNDAIEAALAVSGLRFPEPATAPVVVLARDDTFADALSGAPLSSDGPLLFTQSHELDPRVLDEVDRVTSPDATIYVLGGPGAISDAVVQELRDELPGTVVLRLAGRNRFETSRAIVAETVARHGQANQILLARGFGPASDPNGTAAWADAIAGAAFAAARQWPLLVVPTEGLTRADLDLIDASVAREGLVNLLGGPNALSPAVQSAAAAIRSTRRIAGPNRDATAAQIATTLWGVNASGLRTFTLLNVRRPSGWYLGLASAGYAASIGAPTLSMNIADIPTSSSSLLERCGQPQVEIWVAGSASQITAGIVAEVDRRDGASC